MSAWVNEQRHEVEAQHNFNLISIPMNTKLTNAPVSESWLYININVILSEEHDG